jgi:predicted CXXCH cytochrome family protein
LKRWPWLTGISLALGVGAVVLFVNSCSTAPRTVMAPPEIEGATFVGDQACMDCHATISRAFPASPHARLHIEQAQLAGQQGCESCHGPASKHVASGGGRDKFIVNPGNNPDACFQCHLETQAEFHLPQHHPVIEGKMNCVQCHDPHGMDIMKPARGLSMSHLNGNCAQCHREQTRPFVFEHAAMREGCTVCHNAHGSVNPKLLTVRDNNLCLRCHAQVPGQIAGGSGSGRIFIGKEDHTDHLRFGTCWSSGCHTAVHGSNINPYLFY